MRARLLAILSAYTVSGSLGYFFAKYALEYSSPIFLIALRYAIAGGILRRSAGGSSWSATSRYSRRSPPRPAPSGPWGSSTCPPRPPRS
ncbi:MAG: hypothetical protein ACP5HT_06190 [Conexivisphaera sp.]